jgi:cysteine-rich repeat protein
MGTVGVADVCPEICGDGITYYTPGTGRCDDGNNLPYDGCSPLCYVETGYTCTYTNGGISTCTPICGDGLRF